VKEVVRPPVPGTWMMLQRQQPLTKIKFIEPMYARLVNELPEGKDWLDEVKLDGYRCLAGRDSTGVMLWSRRGNLFTRNSHNRGSTNPRRKPSR
jgi:ATP-dependent DNA ligase